MSLADLPFSAPTGVQAVAHSVDGSELQVTLATGELMTINAATLRAACRCAHCRRAHIDGDIHASSDGINIAGLAWVGGYGVNVTFSDDFV